MPSFIPVSAASGRRVLLPIVVLLCAAPPVVAEKKATPEINPVLLEHVVTAENLKLLEGKTATLVTTRPQVITDHMIELIRLDRSETWPTQISLREEGARKPKRYPLKRIARLTVDDQDYLPEYFPDLRAYGFIDVQSRDAAAAARLQKSGDRFWKTLSAEELEQYTNEERKFVEDVRVKFAATPMKLYETDYFLFLTDMPPGHVAPYLTQLDRMNEALGEAFGFEKGHNVWRGKAVVVAFANEQAFHLFERHVMENPGAQGAQGVCHSFPDGRVVVGCFRGDSPSFFGVVLVHETAHGYVHRYRSTARIPSWINEGIADWVAAMAVPSSDVVRDRQRAAALRMQLTRSLGGFFEESNIEAWQYGIASSMISLLATRDNHKFRRFLNDIKNGFTWQESLQRHYQMTPANLAAAYGVEIGIAGMTP